MMHQLDFTDILESDPTPCSCGKIPNLIISDYQSGKLYNYQCECGMWQGGNGGGFVAYKVQEEALRDWNKPNRRKFNKWHDWKRPKKQGQISIFDELN